MYGLERNEHGGGGGARAGEAMAVEPHLPTVHGFTPSTPSKYNVEATVLVLVAGREGRHRIQFSHSNPRGPCM